MSTTNRLIVDPQLLSRPGETPTEEWESWLEWEGTIESQSPRTPSLKSPSLNFSAPSAGSTSPSEPENLSVTHLSPIYQLPPLHPIKGGAKPATARKNVSRKRKSPATNEDHPAKIRLPRGQKISHNVIEKRYRSNLNDKIAKLRDSVPTLREAYQLSTKNSTKDGRSDSDESGDDQAQSTGVKFNKASVLTKATEYIEELEKTKERAVKENEFLRRRLKEMEKMQTSSSIYVQESGISSAISTSFSPSVRSETCDKKPRIPTTGIREAIAHQETTEHTENNTSSPSSAAPLTAQSEPISDPSGESSQPQVIDYDNIQGLIPLPSEMRRLRTPISQQPHYAPASSQALWEESYILENEPRNGGLAARWGSRILLGSLGMLVVVGHVPEQKHSVESTSGSKHPKRDGLYGLPTELLTEYRGFRRQTRQQLVDFTNSPQGETALPAMLAVAVLLSVLFVVLLYVKQNDPKLVQARISTSTTSVRAQRRSLSRSRSRPPRPETPIHEPGPDGFDLKEFFARGAIALFGHSFMFNRNGGDQEAAIEAGIGEDFRRRWTSYSQSLPKLLDRDRGQEE